VHLNTAQIQSPPLASAYPCAALAIDLTYIRQFVIHTSELITMPLQFIIAFIVLYNYVGAAALFALVGFFATMPLEMWGFVGLGTLYVNMMTLRDQRMKRVVEMCQSIKAIKAATLESFVHARVSTLRQKELSLIRTKNLLVGGIILGFGLKYGLMIVGSAHGAPNPV
jgi:ABC-type bacteriocin/lantibiotic exporter with double-glycine peptidase domain